METGLRGKTALITGGSSGIGRGIAAALAEEGVNLAIASRNPDLAAIAEVEALGVKCVRIAADVSQETEVERMVAMWACREASRHMIARHSGGILIVGSTVRFFPSYRETAYRVSKMGLRMLMQNLAIELAPYGIRVNMVTPGHYRTRLTGGVSGPIEKKMLEIIPAHRFGEPVEVGRAAAFLLSDRLSGYTYGADVVIDGGLTLHPLPLYTQDEIEGFNA